MKQVSTLLLALFLLSTNVAFSQWQLQTLPTTQNVPYLAYHGPTKGKNLLWMNTEDYTHNPETTAPLEFVLTTDGGQTYTAGEIMPTDDYYLFIHGVDDNTAYFMGAKEDGSLPYVFKRTQDGGASWQDMPYDVPAFPDALHFYDANNGIFVGDPDSLGFYFAYTTDGGNTFTRLPQTNYPAANPNEYFATGTYFVNGNTFIIPSINFENGNQRTWRSTDKGRNWTVGEEYNINSPFLQDPVFTDSENGMQFRNYFNIEAYYTHDGGQTWHPNETPLPGLLSGGNISIVPGTYNIVAIFIDTTDQILFSAATNDYGKTWHSRKDLQPYTLDPIYEPNVPAFVWTNLNIYDNHTAWARFSRTDLYRYDSTEPIVEEKPDLELSIVTDNEYLDNYTSVKYTLMIRNRGISAATDVQAHWLPPYNRTPDAGEPFAFQAAYADGGNFNWWTGDWDIKNLGPGQIMTATYHLYILKDEVKVDISAQITACEEDDLDSTPNNGSAGLQEDDEVTFTATPLFASEPVEDRNETMQPISIFPNPVKDVLLINYNFDKITDVSFTINDAVGRLIWSNDLKNAQNGFEKVDCSTFNTGVYFVKTLADGVESNVQKVVIAH
jgi:photosystem II stability/assembly factor-like uncharacterized protein